MSLTPRITYNNKGRDDGFLTKIYTTAGLLGSKNGSDFEHLTLVNVATLADKASGSENGHSCGNADATT